MEIGWLILMFFFIIYGLFLGAMVFHLNTYAFSRSAKWMSNLLIVLAVALSFVAISFFLFFLNITATPSLFIFFSSIWLLIVALIGFGLWMDYYLDALVITNRMILNVEQTGIFKHSVQEFRIEKVQDVTIEAPNFLATFLNYGNITLSTAGEMTFSIKEVPNPHLARDVILKNAKNIGGNPQSL